MASDKIMAIVLAGGEGKRLMPLTADRAKPAVPFGGTYRLIDFALSNIVNSGFSKIVVLTQYKSHSLDLHISRTWRLSPVLGEYVTPVPAQQRVGKHWYLGSADAIYQSLNLISDERPDIVVVVGADHVYRMDFSQMVKQHIETGASCTVAAIRQPIEMANQFGVIDLEPEHAPRIREFLEKPASPQGLADDPSQVLASMGNYVFSTDALVEALTSDANNDDSAHDMGGDIVPYFVERGEAAVYDFKDNDMPGATPRDLHYWRDVGTLASYFEAHQDLVSVHPIFNLYNNDWPIISRAPAIPPAKFVHGQHGRMGRAINSLVSPGTVISGGTVEGSVLSANCRVHSWASVNDSVILDGVVVSRHAQVSRAIVDKNVHIPEGVRIGMDVEEDLARGLTVTPDGLTVVAKGQKLEHAKKVHPTGDGVPTTESEPEATTPEATTTV